MDCLLGIDIGTSGTKSALVGSDGKYLDSEYYPYSIISPQESRAEQDPEDWWTGIVQTVRTLNARKRKTDRIVALSLSTQGGTLLLLDENFSPLGNAVSWLDKRSRETSHELEKRISAEQLYRGCGWSVTDGLAFPLIFWFRQKNPAALKKARYCSSTIDFLNHRLAGRFTTDLSNLAMTQLLDLDKRSWSAQCLDIAGISENQLAEIVPSGNVIAPIDRKAARELGLDPSVLIVSGAHDQYCANIGAGARSPGDCVLSSGTAWVATVVWDKPVFNAERTIHPCPHLLDGCYGLMSSIPSGCNSLNWFQRTFRQDRSVEELGRIAWNAPPGCGGLMFVPPGFSRDRKGAFTGFDTTCSTEYFVRAIMEGVAFSTRQLLDSFRRNGVEISRIIMTGGGARSPLWPQIVADATEVPLLSHKQTEASCAGAAILAGVGCGIYDSIEAAPGSFTLEGQIINPEENTAGVYRRQFERFRSLTEK